MTTDAKPIGHFTSRVLARLRAESRSVKWIWDRQESEERAVLPAVIYASDWRWSAFYLLLWNFRVGLRWRTV